MGVCHKLDPKLAVDYWRALAQRDKFADAVAICTPDIAHYEPAIAFARKGYHILLEKPMAVTESDCADIARVCDEQKTILAVCHVMRYTPANRRIKEMLASGIIGDV